MWSQLRRSGTQQRVIPLWAGPPYLWAPGQNGQAPAPVWEGLQARESVGEIDLAAAVGCSSSSSSTGLGPMVRGRPIFGGGWRHQVHRCWRRRGPVRCRCCAAVHQAQALRASAATGSDSRGRQDHRADLALCWMRCVHCSRGAPARGQGRRVGHHKLPWVDEGGMGGYSPCSGAALLLCPVVRAHVAATVRGRSLGRRPSETVLGR